MFNDDKLPQFQLLVKNDYPSLSDKAIKASLPFVITYFCETGFSAGAVKKKKHQSWLITEKEL
jgi:hypothetical protein